jgi:dCMP deaminase
MSVLRRKVGDLTHPVNDGHFLFYAADEAAVKRFARELGGAGFSDVLIAQLLGRVDARANETQTGERAEVGFSADTYHTLSATVCSLSGGPPTSYGRITGETVCIDATQPPWVWIAASQAFDALRKYMAVRAFEESIKPASEVYERVAAAGRPSWPDRLMKLAEWWAQWSTCSGLQTAAVVADVDNQVLVSGFNGAPRGLPHCEPETRLEDRNGHCLTCVHAEDNCILQAARVGVSLRNGRMYVLHRPCVRCATRIAQLGLLSLTYRYDYDSDGAAAEAINVLEAADVEVRREDGGP